MAKDLYHDAVRSGLEKQAWIITEDFFARRFTQMIVEEVQLKLIVFNPFKEAIVQWKS
jgi:hypothetical protein